MQASDAQNSQNQTMITSFALGHDDFVHDISYDYYGKRLATCSSDQKIKIWDKYNSDSDDEWKQVAELSGHNGIVWKVKWSHPEFGQIIASCAYDKSFIIWEETENKDSTKKTWTKRSNQILKENAQDIKFAPKHLGLVLAVAVGDGMVILFEANDIQNLTSWSEVQKIKVNECGCSCISWNPAFDEFPMIIVGAQSQLQDANHNIQQYLGESLLQLYGRRENSKQFEIMGQFKNGHNSTVNDVAWAPLAGRSYHMIVSCSKDKQIIVWKAVTKNILAGGAMFEQPIIEAFWRVEHQFEVWKVTWNILGTCFCSSADDGCVRIWKKNIKNKFNQLAVLQPKQSNFH